MGIFNKLFGGKDPVQETQEDNAAPLYHKGTTQAEILAREKYPSTLDAVTSRVMIIDDNHLVMKMNQSCKKMLKEAEADIRSECPDFVVDDLVGKAIDVFSRDPARQRRLLEEITDTCTEQVVLGGRTFETIINPIFNPEKKRLGAAIEWMDLTEQLRREEEDRARREKEAALNDFNQTLKSTMEVLSRNVMIADETGNIIFANQAVLDMLRKKEGDIQKKVPGFRTDKVIGSNMDSFHRNPGHQRGLITGLKTTFSSDIAMGDSHFNLTVKPIMAEDGGRKGTLVEWEDTTEIKTFQNDVDQAINSAVDGDIAVRIDLAGREGFIAHICEGFNNLLDIFEKVVKDTEETLGELAKGNLTRKIETEYAGSYGKLKSNINGTIDKLVEVVSEIRESANNVKQGSVEISSGNSNLSERTEEQATSLEETAASMEEITTTVQQNAANALQANTLARGARETAENGGEVVGRAVSAMEAISESSNKITEIISVIDEIAFQTNLLALNAAVEAARAGDQGRGFAVVADEVRSLAGRSATAAKEIKDLIRDSGEKVREGSDLVNKSGETLNEIVTAVKKVNDIVAEISTASEEQASGLDEINKAVTEMDDMTQQNAALVEEAAAASESLGDQAERLDQLLSFFNTGRAAEIAGVNPAAIPAPRPAVTEVRERARTPARPAGKLADTIQLKRKPALDKDSPGSLAAMKKDLPKAREKAPAEPAAGKRGKDLVADDVALNLPETRNNYEDDKNWAEF